MVPVSLIACAKTYHRGSVAVMDTASLLIRPHQHGLAVGPSIMMSHLCGTNKILRKQAKPGISTFEIRLQPFAVCQHAVLTSAISMLSRLGHFCYDWNLSMASLNKCNALFFSVNDSDLTYQFDLHNIFKCNLAAWACYFITFFFITFITDSIKACNAC